MLSSGNGCTVTWPCPARRPAAAGQSGDAELKLALRDTPACCSPQGHIAEFALAGTLLVCCLHSGGVWRPLLAGLWREKRYDLHEDGGFSIPRGTASSLVTFQLPFGAAGWWVFIRSGCEAPLCMSPSGGKGLNSGVWTNEMMS